MLRFFEGNIHAELYKKYRRTTPDCVVERVLQYVEEFLPPPHGLAVDVGCGSGQNTMSFAPYFNEIIGVDVSESQIEEALKTPNLPRNVSFKVAPGEALPVQENSVELVVGSASIHWLDYDKFYQEVDRVLMPNGVLAAITHTFPAFIHPTKSKELNELAVSYSDQVLKPFIHERGVCAFNGYKDLPMPSYGEIMRVDDLHVDVPLTLAEAVMYATTLSSFQQLYRKNPEKTMSSLEHLQQDLLKILDVTTPAEETNVVLRYNYSIVMCRKPSISPKN